MTEHRFDASPTKSLWHHFGPQGETRELTGPTGSAADTYTYTAYGTPVASTGRDPNPFCYGGSVGYYTDPDAYGLVLCGQRWYDPAYGRWLTRAPAGYAGGVNLYAASIGNPLAPRSDTCPRGRELQGYPYAIDDRVPQSLFAPEAAPFFRSF